MENIAIPHKSIEELCNRYDIIRLSLYGSITRDDFTPSSDIDVLIEFDRDVKVSLFDMGEIQMELSELLGREVDLKTPGYLSKDFRQEVVDNAQVLYVREG